jgi:hypothetical protein
MRTHPCCPPRHPHAPVLPSSAPGSVSQAFAEVLIFEDTFDTLNMSIWRHELTLGGGG